MKLLDQVRRYRWGLGAAMIGVGLLVAAFFTPNSGALQGVFLNVGAASLLVLPIAIVSRNLHDEMDAFEKHQEVRLDTAERRNDSKIDHLHHRLAHLEDRDAEVLDQQQANRQKDDERFDAITKPDATGLTLWRALRLAEEFQLVPPQGVHVAYAPDSPLTVSFSRATNNAHRQQNVVNAQLRDGDGNKLWHGHKKLSENTKLDAFLEELDHKARTQRDHSRAKVSAIFGHLAEALKHAANDGTVPSVGSSRQHAVGRANAGGED